jgi:hypothetical protein
MGFESPRRALSGRADRQQLLEEAADLTPAIDEVDLQNPVTR